jgi:uncharacterized membrane protein YfcA
LTKVFNYGFSLGFILDCCCGFDRGLTGVGGGSLMTPILLWFGIPPTTAVGTDLLYASTKMGILCIIKKKISIGPLRSAFSRQVQLHY